MTHSEFNELYDDGKIDVKIYQGTLEDGTEKTIETFTYNGKYYLRIHFVKKYITGERAYHKKYKMTKENHFIKEFDNRISALNYFFKASEGLVRSK